MISTGSAFNAVPHDPRCQGVTAAWRRCGIFLRATNGRRLADSLMDCPHMNQNLGEIPDYAGYLNQPNKNNRPFGLLLDS